MPFNISNLFRSQKDTNSIFETESRIIEKIEKNTDSLLQQSIKSTKNLSSQIDELFSHVDENVENIIKTINTAQSETKAKDELIKTIIFLCDLIESFCVFADEQEDMALKSQSVIMRGSVAKRLQLIGVGIINNQMFDPELNSPCDTTSIDGLEDNIITKVVEQGYIYNGMVIRRSKVIVNKKCRWSGWTKKEELLELT